LADRVQTDDHHVADDASAWQLSHTLPMDWEQQIAEQSEGRLKSTSCAEHSA
jgi:hypothetical protein